ncbi:DinB family protein [Chitinophaga sp. 30R24]|uniref:DinB family protein n=1 Tax=Chitinophaga sp. 30R24 TaxID=3248838 RepID=UPI003B8F92AE
MPLPFVSTNKLLRHLLEQMSVVRDQTTKYINEKTTSEWQWSPGTGTWSAIQCLEHLNTYGRYYLPALEKTISAAENAGSRPYAEFSSSFLGAYFTRLMLPGNQGQLRFRMKSPWKHLPSTQPAVADVLAEFLLQQERMEKLLRRAYAANIQDYKVPTSLFSLVRLSVGDTFGFLVAHIQRHLLQVEKALAGNELPAHGMSSTLMVW